MRILCFTVACLYHVAVVHRDGMAADVTAFAGVVTVP